jgi:hypothetical protein
MFFVPPASHSRRSASVSKEFPRDHIYTRDRVLDMETIGTGACGVVECELVDGTRGTSRQVRARTCLCVFDYAYLAALMFTFCAGVLFEKYAFISTTLARTFSEATTHVCAASVSCGSCCTSVFYFNMRDIVMRAVGA